MWSFDLGNSGTSGAPEGTARLWDGETLVGTVDAAYAFVIVARMNERPQRVRNIRTIGGAL